MLRSCAIVAGAVVAVGAAVALTAVTGGLAAPLAAYIGATAASIAVTSIVAGGTALAASAAFGAFNGAAETVEEYGDKSGKIEDGCHGVYFNGRRVARVGDPVLCDKHGPAQIAEGCATVYACGLAISQIGHKTTCDGNICEGWGFIGVDAGTNTAPGQSLPVDSAVPWALNSLSDASYIVAQIIGLKGPKGDEEAPNPSGRPPDGDLPPPKPDADGFPPPNADDIVVAGGRPPSSPQNRPTWRQSEKDVAAEYGGVDNGVSYLNREPVENGRPGSARPDVVVDNTAIEVKNYDLSRPNGKSSLIRDASNSINKQSQHIPPDMDQMLVVDIRGQNVSVSDMSDIAQKISDRTGLDIADIKFKTQ